ncbi:MAG: glycosyltransferase family 2 protein [Gammaproteobacteria bacterium]|nr:glycosyltransferase family 2 protein [Gammaproteobacteria bacterium]NNJ83690.1 glycosyltransferase family 2 protein [Gammaproteobacteria bacterium]
MKLIIQIPCFNEEHTLPETIGDLPDTIEGIDRIETLIIDDGSTDRTIEVAREMKVDHIVRNTRNIGLAGSFQRGLDACLALGADIIVNTDGDNQYAGKDIAKLVRPILDGKADIVIGDRQTHTIAHFSAGKKFLQKLGSGVVRQLSDTEIPDVVSGFRAISRDAALKLNIMSPYSYTVEMVIQAGKKKIAIAHVPVATNPKTRESRLIKSIPAFIGQQLISMIRMYAMFKPLRVFFYIGLIVFILGAIPVARFLYFYFSGDGGGHLQSLVLGGVLMNIGFITFVIGLLADLISANRKLIETTLEKIRRIELGREGEYTRMQDK